MCRPPPSASRWRAWRRRKPPSARAREPTRSRMAGPLNPPGLARFKELFSGEVVLPGEPSYDQARVVWNAIADRRAALGARCSSVDDVVSAIRYARAQELTVAVRGGGHSVAGFATCDDGMVIDLSRMREVAVDPARRWARAEGGAHL